MVQRLLRAASVVVLMIAFSGCEGIDPFESVTGSDSDGSSSGGGLEGINWLGEDISGWDETASLTASVSGDHVVLNYDKAGEWPAKDNVNASAWVVFDHKGATYAATFDYLRPGQTSKDTGFYIPVSGGKWRPSSGARVGFIVSGLARDSRRTVYERSNIAWVTWP